MLQRYQGSLTVGITLEPTKKREEKKREAKVYRDFMFFARYRNSLKISKHQNDIKKISKRQNT